MVEVRAASIISEHATCVVLEDLLVGLDGDRDGLLCNGGLEVTLGLSYVCMPCNVARLEDL